MLETYLKEASSESSSEPIIKAAIELAAISIKEGPVALCSCLSYFIAANRRLKQEIKVLQQEVEEYQKQCSCQAFTAQQTALRTDRATTKYVDNANESVERTIHQPRTTTTSLQKQCDAGSQPTPVSVNNDRLCWPHNNDVQSCDATSGQQQKEACSLASGPLLQTVVADVHTRSSTHSLHEPSDEYKRSTLRYEEQTCDQPEDPEVVSLLPLLGCLCKACQFLLKDPALPVYTLNDDTKDCIVAPGNRVLVEACSLSTASRQQAMDARTHPAYTSGGPLPQRETLYKPIQNNPIPLPNNYTKVTETSYHPEEISHARSSLQNVDEALFQYDISSSQSFTDESDKASSSSNDDQVVTVVYFGHDRETPHHPLQPQPVGIVALFGDGVERFVPLSKVMYHLSSDEEDEADTDYTSTRSLSSNMALRTSSEPETPNITPDALYVEESSQAKSDELSSSCISTNKTDGVATQHPTVTRSINSNVERESPVSSVTVDSVPCDQHGSLKCSIGSNADISGSSHTNRGFNKASLGVSVPPHSSMGADSSEAVEQQGAATLTRSQSDESCNGEASSTASHSLECLSLCAGDTERYLNTSADSAQWAHMGYPNAGYDDTQETLAKSTKENTDGSCGDELHQPSSESHPPSVKLKTDHLALDVSLYESSDSAISISFANSQQSSFWSTASSSTRNTFRSLNVRDSSADSKRQFVGLFDAETCDKNCVRKPRSLNYQTSEKKQNSTRTMSTSENSGTDLLNKAFNLFRRRSSAEDIYQLENVSNV